MRSPRTALARMTRHSDGFTLVEMVVAVAIALIIFLGGAAALTSMLRTTTESRLKQHATEVLTEAIEDARGVDYRSLGMDANPSGANATDLATLAATSTPAAHRITGSAGSYAFDPDGSASGFSSESLVTMTAGAAIDPLRVANRNGALYTVRTYVTVPATSGGLLYRRVTVHITWVQNGRTYERTSSTFVTDTRRGLPLPNFSLTGRQTGVAVTAGTSVAFKAKLTNNGARDRWTFSATSTAGWTFAWYRDTDLSGTFDGSVDELITDTDANGTLDSGALETDASVLYFGVTSVPATATAGAVSITFTAAAVSQTTVTRTLTHTANVISTTCVLCSWKVYWLRNGNPKKVLASNYTPTPAPANPNEETIETDPPVLAPLYDFDNTDGNSAGRYLQRTSAGNSESAVGKIVVWKYTYPVKTYQKTGNTGAVHVWARTSGGGDGTVTLTAYLYRPTGSGGPATVVATGSASRIFTGDGGTFAEFVIPLPVTTTESVNASKPLELRLINEGSMSTVDAVVAYDTTTYRAYVKLPESLT